MKSFKKTSALLITLLTVALIACIVSFVMLCIRGADPHLYKKDPGNNISSAAKLNETFDYGDGYIKKMVFVGDRTIAPISNSYPSIKATHVWTGIDGTIPLDYNLSTLSIVHSETEKPTSIPSAAEIYVPEYMIITVGIDNGVGHCTEEKFKEYYINLIDAVKEASPDTKIILQSIFPVSKAAEKENPTISNDRIRNANIWISEVCELASIRYLDTASKLADDKGYLNSKYDSGDGITLNDEGYGVVIEYIKTHGYK